MGIHRIHVVGGEKAGEKHCSQCNKIIIYPDELESGKCHGCMGSKTEDIFQKNATRLAHIREMIRKNKERFK